MAFELTEAQRAAIYTDETTLLVSAAAGAGKTLALTKRLIHRLTNPVNKDQKPADLSKMLIVTFTRAAASELRERISNALSKKLAETPGDTNLSNQIVKVAEAQISTIDSFFLNVVRDNFASLGLPPKFRMADEAELVLLKNEVMNNTIEDFYRKGAEYCHFFDHFSEIRNDLKLAEIFLSLYSDLLRYPSGLDFLTENAEYLRTNADKDYFETKFGEQSAKDAEDIFAATVTFLESALAYCEVYEPMKKGYGTSLANDLSHLRTLLASIRARQYSETRSLLYSYVPEKLGSMASKTATEETKRYQALRKKFTEQVCALKDSHFLLSVEDISRAMRESATVSDQLFELLSAYDKSIKEEKLRRSICDFDDIRSYTYSLLVNKDRTPTELARKYASRYDEIYIDEYQDVDSIQDLIFKSIANDPDNNRFLVGDIKQSIYGFRGANPSVFSEYRRKFPTIGTPAVKDLKAAAIYMSENFRCNEPVIHFANLVCSTLFKASAEKLAYTSKDDLIPKKPPMEGLDTPPVEVVLISNEEKNRLKKENPDAIPKEMAEESEGAYIAARILELNGNVLVFDKDNDKIRPAELKDFAILGFTGPILQRIEKELNASGIETSFVSKENFFETPSVLLLLSLLNTIDNPHRDIYLTATLRSPLYLFTLEEIARIREEIRDLSLYDALAKYRENHPESATASKISIFLDEITRYRALAQSMSADKLIRHVFDNPRLAVTGAFSEDGDKENLLQLYEYARRFEAGAFRGLSQFVSYVERLIDSKVKMKAPGGANPNAVRLMTIHASKGLEFPICFLAGMGRAFDVKEIESPVLDEEELGAAMLLSDESGLGRINTPMLDAVKARITEKALEEQMRVLYVALTRARERLIITARPFGVSSAMKKIESRALFPSRFAVMQGRSYLDWILYALHLSGNDGAPFTSVRMIESTNIRKQRPSGGDESTSDAPYTEEEVEACLKILRERFDYAYPHKSTSTLPAKLSVSALSPTVLDELEEKAVSAITQKDTEPSEAALEGTATHCFMQFCELKTGLSVEDEMKRLVDEQFLSEDTASRCLKDELQAFLSGPLLKRLSEAKRVYREQRFNIFLPADPFTQTKPELSGEKILVQGVIDLFFIDKNDRLVLCDYKTDRVSENAKANDRLLAAVMKNNHGRQLSYYALALEQLVGRKPDEILVYSTAAGKAVEIKL